MFEFCCRVVSLHFMPLHPISISIPSNQRFALRASHQLVRFCFKRPLYTLDFTFTSTYHAVQIKYYIMCEAVSEGAFEKVALNFANFLTRFEMAFDRI